tara:strand:- start:478 stop:1197 length:720 start_codon:yes stop_codon:yes gene_type:complete
MAKYGSNDVGFLLIDGFDVTGVSTSLTDTTTATLEETHGLGDSWAEHTATGLRSATLAADGFYDDASDSANEALAENEASSRVVCYGYEGNTIHKGMVGHTGAFGGSYTRTASRNELHKASATWTVTGQKDDAMILHALGSESASGTGGAANNDASSADGGAAYLQVTVKSGTTPTLDAKVRDSADNSTYADLISFTQATGVTAERKTVSGTVNQYTLASWTHGGTAPEFTFLIGFARA